jgi:hypothetical protein
VCRFYAFRSSFSPFALMTYTPLPLARWRPAQYTPYTILTIHHTHHTHYIALLDGPAQYTIYHTHHTPYSPHTLYCIARWTSSTISWLAMAQAPTLHRNKI